MCPTDEIACKNLTRDLLDLTRFEVIDDASKILPQIASVVRVNSISGTSDNRRADVRVKLASGREATLRIWAYGNADGTGIQCEVIR